MYMVLYLKDYIFKIKVFVQYANIIKIASEIKFQMKHHLQTQEKKNHIKNYQKQGTK